MSRFRFLIVSITGEVTGTNDEAALTHPCDSDDISCVIDTQDQTYTNEDDEGVAIEAAPEVDPEEEE